MIRKLFCLMLLVMITHQQLSALPVSSDLVLKLTLSMSKLQSVLQYFGTWYQNKFDIYKRVQLTKGYLGQLNSALSQYNNVILGNNTTATGNKNIIIGNYNNVTGSNNWVFISNYTGRINGDLLLGNWRIQLDKDNLILINTRFAISYINDPNNQYLWGKYGKQKKFCNWKSKNTTTTAKPVQTTNPYGMPSQQMGYPQTGFNTPYQNQNTYGYGSYGGYNNNLNTNNGFGGNSWNWGW